MKKFLAAVLFVVLAASSCFAFTEYPVTIENGNRSITFYSAPSRVVTNCDANIIEMLLALGLKDKIIGYAGYLTEDKISPQYRCAFKEIPALSKGNIDFQTLYKAKPDLFISSYKYGLDTGKTGITPEILAKNLIKTYAMTESLFRVMPKPPVTLEDIYTDIKNLGVIFDVQDRAEQIIHSMRLEADIMFRRVSAMKISKPLKVFIAYAPCKDDNFLRSAGNQSIVNALLEIVKARNIFSDVNDGYIQVQWQDVIKRNPDVIIIFDGGNQSGEKYKHEISKNSLLGQIKAVGNNRIYVIPLEDIYPGVRAIKDLELITRSLYPKYKYVNRHHRFNRHYLRRYK